MLGYATIILSPRFALFSSLFSLKFLSLFDLCNQFNHRNMAFNFSPEDIARFQAFLTQLSTTAPPAVQTEPSSSSSTEGTGRGSISSTLPSNAASGLCFVEEIL